MFNVLIADDEVSICRLITYLLPWNELDLSLVDIVYNGYAAMDVIRSKKVDILITDAKMPGCDGIELIKWCQENNIAIKCIVISGFRQFDYVHGAINYGADAYLLKPIHQDQLIDALNKVIDKIEENRNSENLHSRLENSKKNMREYFMNTFLLDNIEDQNIYLAEDPDTINDKYMLNLYEGFYQMLYFKVVLKDVFNNYSIDNNHKDYVLSLIKEDVELYFDSLGCEHIESIYKTGVYSFVNYRQMKMTEFLARIQYLYTVLETKLENLGNYLLIIGLSQTESKISAIRKIRLYAIEAANYRLRYPGEKIFVHNSKEFVKVDISTILTNEVQELIQMYSTAANITGLKNVLFKCHAALKKTSNYDPSSLYELIRYFFNIILSDNDMNIDFETTTLKKELDFILDNAIQEAQLWTKSEMFIEKIGQLIQYARQNGKNKPVANAKNYIDLHFMEAITLDDVARAVHLNPRYLCKVFHEQTGLTYSEYLTIKRMECAAEKLQKEKISIAQIAESVGYQDVKYFTKLFKKQLGVKPSTYRRIYS